MLKSYNFLGVTIMELVHSIENKLEPMFKGAPKLSDSNRKSLGDILPWLALVFGILQLIAAFLLFGAASVSSVLVSYVEAVTGQPVISAFDKMLIYGGVLLVVVDAAILLLAFPKLNRRAKSGWDLLFLGAVLNAVYGIYNVLTSLVTSRTSIMSTIISIIASAIGFWLLFEVKGQFTSTDS